MRPLAILMTMKSQQIGETSQRESDFQRKLAAAHGCFKLRMWNEAWAELEKLEPEFSHLPEVIILRVLILSSLERWEDAAMIGERDPEIPGLRIALFGDCRSAAAFEGSCRGENNAHCGRASHEKRGHLSFHPGLLQFRPGTTG
jgi:hypothetical protein